MHSSPLSEPWSRADAIYDASSRGLIELAGPETLTFLHNLATNDIKSLTPGQTRETFLTTNKAKIITHGYVTRLDQPGDPVLWLDVPTCQNDVVFKHLDRHLISERVVLTDRTGEFGRLRVFATDHAPFADAGMLRLAETGLGPSVVDYVAPSASIEALRSRFLQAGFQPMDEAAYEVVRIEAGLPKMGTEMDETRFVVEVDRTAQAICYTKGCYLGQEPIVMARDRGQVNRLLRGLLLPAEASAGSPVYRDGAEVGKITSSVFSPRRGQAIALAYLRRGNWEPGTQVFLDKDTNDRAATVVSLPFA